MGEVPSWIPPGLDSLTTAVAYLNGLGYNLSWGDLGDRWGVRTGDQSLFVGASEDEVRGFVFGLAVANALREAHDRVTLPRPPRPATPPPTVYGAPLPPDGRWPPGEGG